MGRECTYAGFDTGGPITHWVDARLCWISLDHNLELGLTTLELFLPISALGLAEVENEGFRVHATLQHVLLRVNCNVHPIFVVVLLWVMQSWMLHDLSN